MSSIRRLIVMQLVSDALTFRINPPLLPKRSELLTCVQICLAEDMSDGEIAEFITDFKELSR